MLRFSSIHLTPEKVNMFGKLMSSKGLTQPKEINRPNMHFDLANQKVTTSSLRTFQFLSKEAEHGVDLADDWLVIKTSRYHSWGQFSEWIKLTLQSFSDACDQAVLCTHFGIRYVNIFDPGEAGTSAYLQPGLCGLDPSILGGNHFHHNYQFWQPVGKLGNLVIRVSTDHADRYLPQDLREMNLYIEPGFETDHKKMVCRIDLEVNQSGNGIKPPARLDVTDALDRYGRSRERIKTAFFDGCITPTAKDSWSKENK